MGNRQKVRIQQVGSKEKKQNIVARDQCPSCGRENGMTKTIVDYDDKPIGFACRYCGYQKLWEKPTTTVTNKMDFFGIPSEESLLLEMSNVPSRVHRFGVDVKLNLLQPGKRVYSHAERVKIFRGDQWFVVDLKEDPTEIKHREGQVFLSKRDYEKVIEGVRKYRIPFFIFWYSPQMDIDDLDILMKQVDQGILTAIPDDIREKMHE